MTLEHRPMTFPDWVGKRSSSFATYLTRPT